MKETDNLIDRIEQSLERYHGFTQSSCVTRAVAFVLFNCYSSTLVNYFGDPQAMRTGITKSMIQDACKFVESEVKKHL